MPGRNRALANLGRVGLGTGKGKAGENERPTRPGLATLGLAPALRTQAAASGCCAPLPGRLVSSAPGVPTEARLAREQGGRSGPGAGAG